MPANNEQPDVKQSQGAGPAEPIPLDGDPPLDVVVRLPTVSPSDRETTPTESIDNFQIDTALSERMLGGLL